MPGIEVPKWFNYICKDGIPCLWVRGKFHNVALALVFQYADGKERIDPDFVQLHLVINGQFVPQKVYYNFIIEPHHVLVCDLQLLFNDEESINLDALHEWNQVQISYEVKNSIVTLSEWGVFLNKQGAVDVTGRWDGYTYGFTYDVFLSFRGKDTQINFIAYLREAFQMRGINAFYDDNNLRIGQDISPALCKAIEESHISVIVLSEDYASSTWCLDELAKIMECTKRNNKQIAFPIFYHVDPSDVRHQRKSYGEAMVAHQKRFGKESEKIKAWTAALSEVADLKGHHIHTGFEINHVKEIADKVHTNIAPKPLIDGENPVGLDQRIEEVKSLLDLKPNDDTVCILGIIGLGGIGKTELAKALYNKIVRQFEAVSFLANVREKSNTINGLKNLQKTLLEWGSTSKGINELKHKLGRKKVLLVLDDVDERKQLENLAGGNDWFGPGSRIIITTRDKSLLMGTYPIEVIKTYAMTELNEQLSLELFCRNAFGKSNPKTGFEAVSSRAVGYAKGLPLALKVIGSNLRTRKSLKAWEDALEDYERIPRKEIQDVLKISYDVLEPSAQSVFLDIACFFKGESIKYVEEILEEFSAASNIEELVNKSLLNVDDGYLNMHDLIQDMGREIVRQEAPNNPAKRSRLWFHQDIIDVLSSNDSGSDAIQGILFDPPGEVDSEGFPRKIKVDWNHIVFEKMHYLRILIVRCITFSSKPKRLPNHLRLLDWKNYPSKTLPPEFYPSKIINLNLRNSELTIKKPFEQFLYLTVMDFSHNSFMKTMPDVSKVENLRELRLDRCDNLTTVHESIGFLKHLVHLSASLCGNLKIFLQKMFLPSLEVLDLNCCEQLEHFPDIVKEMNKPLKIYLRYTSIKKLPNSVGNLIGLVSIYMGHSHKLEYLPSSLFRLPNVVAFQFGGCSKLGESFKRFVPDSPSEANEHSTLKTVYFSWSGLLDEDIHTILICFPNLEELNVSSSDNLVSLPACIEESNHLTNLDVSWCKKLKEIPECTNLRILNVNNCTSLVHISELPCTIQKIDARECFNLSWETINILWDQVKKERHGLEIVMPRTKVPEWFDCSRKGGIPCLWIRRKFPINVYVAFMFQKMDGEKDRFDAYVFKLCLVINGRSVLQKKFKPFRIQTNHVLVCDLRRLYNDDEWLSIDALLLNHEWNQVQISYEDIGRHSGMTLSEWGVFVSKQGTVNWEEHVQFMCPDPTSSTTHLIPPLAQLVTDIVKEGNCCADEISNIGLSANSFS
ncbi:hypothetical protein TSUD_252980 [Trifolium subterraneum]|nr:hypothetical protein TSUD_252980 [Trifolium subterraneum]